MKEPLLYGIIGLLGGAIIAGFAAGYAVNNDHKGMMRMMGMRTSNQMEADHMGDVNHMGMSMDDMAGELRNKNGDDFDKAFIEQMIDHHQGAIDMANLAKQNAKHEEIKQLADNIISAQAKEINEMQSWRRAWNY